MILIAGYVRVVLLALVCVFSTVLWCQSPAKGTPYRITGVVVSSRDGSPVRRCHLAAYPAMQGGPGAGFMGAAGRRGGGPPGRFAPVSGNSIEADDSGHFSLTLPSPGAWNLTASAPGYATGAFEQHGQYSSSIVLTAEAPTYDLVFRLSPAASIIGVVLDEAGEPIRNAQVVLHIVPAPSPDGSRAGGTRGATQTDDRGMYEFADLQPGQSFRVTVQARPWYAAAAQQGRGNTNGGATDPSSALDPSLDVTYPLLWYPGVDDPAQAETVTVHAGESYQADFQLTPVPSIHLRIIPPVSVDASGRNIPSFPIVERIVPGGGGMFGGGPMPMMNGGMQNGQVEVSGLTPGTYQIRLQGQNGMQPRTAVVEVTPGSVRTLDLSAASPAMANVTLLLDGIPDTGPGENSIQIGLIDTETGEQFFPANGPMNGFGGGNAANQRRRSEGPAADRAQTRRGRMIEVRPGRYEVTLSSGRSNTYLTGITAQGGEVHGRDVTFRAGDSTLTLHVATGLATLMGNVTMHNKPTVGASVLLVPASLGDPGSFATVGQDQSNTDGSFDITGITPGQYILIAIDHGWEVNWNDPSTLRHYLMQGTPIDLASSEKVKQKVEAQSP